MSGARSPRPRCGAMRRPPGPTREAAGRLSIPASPEVKSRVRTMAVPPTVAVRVRTARGDSAGDDCTTRPGLRLGSDTHARARPERYGRVNGRLASRGRIVTGERLTYRFGPLERRGLLGQLRGGQAGAVATGAAAAIVVLDRAPTAGGAFLGTLLLGVSVLIAFAPLGRRTAEEWAPIVFAFSLRLCAAGSGSARARRPAGCWRRSAPGRCGGCSAIRHQMLRPRSEASGSSTRLTAISRSAS